MSDTPEPTRCKAPTARGLNAECERNKGHEGEHGGRSMGEVMADARKLEQAYESPVVSDTPEPRTPKRYLAWLCEGCDECEPHRGPTPKVPCSDSPSLNGAEVVLASAYDTAVELLWGCVEGFEHHDGGEAVLVARTFLVTQERPGASRG